MGLFPRKKKNIAPCEQLSHSVARSRYGEKNPLACGEMYRQLRTAVPIIDAAIGKIIRLTGDFKLVTDDEKCQSSLDDFVQNVPVGLTGVSLQTFADGYLDSLLTDGNALGEMLIDPKAGRFVGLSLAKPQQIRVYPDKKLVRRYARWDKESGEEVAISHPERILFSALSPSPEAVYGESILHGLPVLSDILLRIYECMGQNFDRCGNVRYAVAYHPPMVSDTQGRTSERVEKIATEWGNAMRASACGEVRDFVCAGDVDVQVIGADAPMLETEIPVRQLLEQLIAKLSIPPFLLGLNWSSTERMSSQQADILTSELEFYRRQLEPVLRQIGTAYLRIIGSQGMVKVEWSLINLQDEVELAKARLTNAQAEKLENGE